MGGNVFKNCEPFDQKYTSQLVDQLNQVLLALDVTAIPIGSSASPVNGQFSNDLDVIVEESVLGRQFNDYSPRSIRKKLKQAFVEAGFETDQSGVSVHVNIPYNGNYHQADIMVVDHANQVSKFHVHEIPCGSPYKGVNKQLAMFYLAKKQNLLWSAFQGLFRRDANGKKAGFITRDLDRVAYILLGVNATADSLKNLESMISVMDPAESQVMLENLQKDPNWKEF